MATENKEDLVKKNAVLEAKISNFERLQEELILLKKQVVNEKKEREEIIANEHHIRQLLEKSKNELSDLKIIIENKNKESETLKFSKDKEIENLKTSKDKEIENLKNELNKLAVLFDEYIVAYQDQVKMLGVFVKNTQTVEKYLTVKINEFNGGDKK